MSFVPDFKYWMVQVMLLEALGKVISLLFWFGLLIFAGLNPLKNEVCTLRPFLHPELQCWALAVVVHISSMCLSSSHLWCLYLLHQLSK